MAYAESLTVLPRDYVNRQPTGTTHAAIDIGVIGWGY